MTLSRRSVLVLAMAAVSVSTLPAIAATPPVFATDGIAIHGTDPVAYFTESKAVDGSDAFTFDWMGATWRFASAENRDLFAANPTDYAPQFGGYCAYAASKGAIATSVPEAWTIYNGKLYLNFSLGVRTIWRKDIPGNIAKAEGFWPGILD